MTGYLSWCQPSMIMGTSISFQTPTFDFKTEDSPANAMEITQGMLISVKFLALHCKISYYLYIF